MKRVKKEGNSWINFGKVRTAPEFHFLLSTFLTLLLPNVQECNEPNGGNYQDGAQNGKGTRDISHEEGLREEIGDNLQGLDGNKDGGVNVLKQ